MGRSFIRRDQRMRIRLAACGCTAFVWEWISISGELHVREESGRRVGVEYKCERKYTGICDVSAAADVGLGSCSNRRAALGVAEWELRIAIWKGPAFSDPLVQAGERAD